MTMNRKEIVALLEKAIRLSEKCGGPGGKPGPCPGGRKPKPGQSFEEADANYRHEHGNGPKKPAKPSKKPPKKPSSDTPHLAPLDYGPVKPPAPPKDKTAWQKAVNVAQLAYQKAGKKVDGLLKKVGKKIDSEFKISGMKNEVKSKITSFVDRIKGVHEKIKKSVTGLNAKIHSSLDSMAESLQKAAPVQQQNGKPGQQKPQMQQQASDQGKILDSHLKSLSRSTDVTNFLAETLTTLDSIMSVKSGDDVSK